jgi:hypothetical protein
MRLVGIHREVGGEGTKWDHRLYEVAESVGTGADGYREPTTVLVAVAITETVPAVMPLPLLAT